MVDKFMMILLPILPPVFGSQILIRYLEAQGIVRPTLLIGLITNVFAVGLNFLLVVYLKLGFWGVAISFVIAYYFNLFSIFSYIYFGKIYKKTWMGWSIECLYNWKEFICLALPGMLMICLEWWSFEIGAFLMGRFGESTLAAHGVLVQIVTLMFMVPLGISVAAAVRVGHSLGAYKPLKAKLIMKLAISLTLICVSLVVVILVSTRKYIAMAFSDNGEIIDILIKTIPIMSVLCFLDATQGVCSGVVRGTGQQKIGVVINFISYDFVGIPLGILLAFVIDLRLAGMWWGLVGGLSLQASLYVTLLCCTNWKKQADLARKRTGAEHHSTNNDREHMMEPGDGEVLETKCEDTNGTLCVINDITDPSRTERLWFSKTSSLHDLDRITLKTSLSSTSAFLKPSQIKHMHSIKRVICIRLIPMGIAVLVLCVTLGVRMLVPLPEPYIYHQLNHTTAGNQTTRI